jgi:hypothetical protein
VKQEVQFSKSKTQCMNGDAKIYHDPVITAHALLNLKHNIPNHMHTCILCAFQIDLATFLTLTDQDLKELGITTFGARRKMLLAIAGNHLIFLHSHCLIFLF